MSYTPPTRMESPNPGSHTDGYHMRRVVTTNQIELHWHNFYEIDFIDGGEGTHLLNGVSLPYRRGSMTVLGTFDFHAYTHSDEQPISVYSFHFNDHVVDAETLSRLSHLVGKQLCCTDEDCYSSLLHCFRRLEQESVSDAPQRDAMVRHLLGQVSIYAARCAELSEQESSGIDSFGEIEYVERNFRQQITLASVARVMGFSEDYFGKLFKHRYGCTFRDYLVGRRLQWAYGLLRSSTLSVTAIAYEAGFNSHAYFCRSFKRRYGITPLQARSKSRTKTDPTEPSA